MIKQDAINTLQVNKGINIKSLYAGQRILQNVTITFMALIKEDKPAKCKLKIKKSTLNVRWKDCKLKGGYKVQPVPKPPSKRKAHIKNIIELGNNQKLKLFNLGKAISRAPNCKGTK